MKKPKFDGFTVLVFIVLLVGLLTHIIPASQFERVTDNGKVKVVPGTNNEIPSQGLNLYEIIKTIPEGIHTASALIIMILVIGGAIHLFERTGAITNGINGLINKIGLNRSKYVIMALFLFFACLGAFPGMLEASIPFAPLCVSVALLLGYDVIVGMAVPLVGITVGWTAGPTNPWTVGIAHNLAGLPMFSGIGFRLVLLAVFIIAALIFILRYAERVKKDPSKSLSYELTKSRKIKGMEESHFGMRDTLILLIFVLTILAVVVGGLYYDAGLMDMSAIYIIGAVIGGLVAGFNVDKIIKSLLEGGKAIFIGAMAVGVSRSISLIMERGAIMDTVIHGASESLKGFSTAMSSEILMLIQCVINFAVPSGSGQAMATLPVILPIADLVNLSEQTAILAFQFGDGFSNLFYPTVGVLIAFLAYTKISYLSWLKFIWPLVVVLYAIGAISLFVAVKIDY